MISFDINLLFKGVFFISLFISCVFFLKKMHFYFIIIKKWKTVEGVVLKSEKVYFRSKSDSDHEGWKDSIVYFYIVDEIEYQNDEITKNMEMLLPFENQVSPLSFENFKTNQKVNVFYNPINPQESILDSKFNYFSLFLTSIFFTIFYLFIF
jgi:hypothetical protein